MDQATPKNKILLGPIGKCSANTSVDGSGGLRIGSNSKEEIHAKTHPLRNITDFEHLYF
ncbi:MAG: hypothetical protein JSR71_13230 [Proteobacteria bacterium]|nr:hypothetical protein [Pseudomonadota bacterium]